MKKYHFTGIKGSGMSSLAQILYDLGNDVRGSDIEDVLFTQKGLEERNIALLPFDEKNIVDEREIIIGNAFPDTHIEIQKAKSIQKNVHRYHDFLRKFMNDYISIAVTGTHGKTTTTGFLSHVLKDQKKTSYLIGDGTGFGEKNSTHFVMEACEYKNHFLSYNPDYAIITNIEWDHPDFFKTEEEVIASFQQFINQVKKGLVVYGEDENIQKLKFNVPYLTYGYGENQCIYAKNIQVSEEGTKFDVFVKGEFYSSVFIKKHGKHNVLNTLAVIGICYLNKLDKEKVTKSLSTYLGVKRRFQEEKIKGYTIIDDYAHHPTEIKATIEAAKSKYPHKKVIAIFQPHTFTRTKTFLEDFAESLKEADKVYLEEIFGSVRENSEDISIHALLDKIPKAEIISIETIQKLKEHKEDVLLFMGAGNIQKLENALKKQL